jgi:hypothetical protein
MREPLVMKVLRERIGRVKTKTFFLVKVFSDKPPRPHTHTPLFDFLWHISDKFQNTEVKDIQIGFKYLNFIIQKI